MHGRAQFISKFHNPKKKQLGKKEPEIINSVVIGDYAAEGRCVARVDGMVVFVEKAVPGDVADVRIYSRKKNLCQGVAVRIVEPSALRVNPVCVHFGTCGGCKWQDLEYASQTRFKQQQVADSLARIGKVAVGEMRPILSAPDAYRYRNRLDYSFSANRWLTQDEVTSGVRYTAGGLGFHVPRRWDKVIDISECHLQPEPGNSIRNRIRELALKHEMTFWDPRAHTGFLRNLTLRNTLAGDWMLLLAVGEDRPDDLALLLDDAVAEFPQLRSVQYVVNRKHNDTIHDLDVVVYHGDPHLTETMDGLSFRIGPKSFFQTNGRQAHVLYEVARTLAGLQSQHTVYDLYTGTGTIALYMANRCNKVMGIDYVKAAIDDAVINAQLNGVTNTEFMAGDMKDVFTPDLIARFGSPDVVVTDPPRAGMDDRVVDRLIECAPERIVYVSCNPATQARDLARLDLAYSVEVCQPVDMFPHTHHVENVVLLKRRDN